MEIADVKAWLMECRNLAQRTAAQRVTIQRVQAHASSMTQDYSGMPKGGAGSDKILDTVCRSDEESYKLSQLLTDLTCKRIDAIKRIYSCVGCDNGYGMRIADYMRCYYIECETKGKRGEFRLKSYEDVAWEFGVSSSTILSGIKIGWRVLAECWDDYGKD